MSRNFDADEMKAVIDRTEAELVREISKPGNSRPSPAGKKPEAARDPADMPDALENTVRRKAMDGAGRGAKVLLLDEQGRHVIERRSRPDPGGNA